MQASSFFSSQLLAALVALSLVGAAARPAHAQSFPLKDANGLELHGLKAEPVQFLGRKAVRLTTISQGDESGFAFLPGVDFQDGTIEADVAVHITTPPGVRMPGFTGIGFRAKSDGKAYELFYLRPKNALAEDQAQRNHSIQYTSEPEYSWYKLRREWPYVYESYADIAPETWIHMKIEVAGRGARIFLNGSSKPSLIVDGTKGTDLHGRVALWGYAGEESYFSNVRVTAAGPQPVSNGSDATGTWTVVSSTDAGRYEATMQLTRDGDKLTGTWSGGLGDNRAITGTWRDGYVELAFDGDWPAGGQGTPGPARVVLAGWFDGAAGKGRMRVEGKTDGVWAAQRKTP